MKKLNWDGNYKQQDGEKVRMVNLSLEIVKGKKNKLIYDNSAIGSLIRFLIKENVKYLDLTLNVDKWFNPKTKEKIKTFFIYVLKKKKEESYNIENLAIEFNKLTSSNLKKK